MTCIALTVRVFDGENRNCREGKAKACRMAGFCTVTHEVFRYGWAAKVMKAFE